MRILLAGLLSLLACFSWNTSNATHSLGGEFTYKFLGGNSYQLNIRIYQDCNDGDDAVIRQDNPLIYALFNQNGARISVDTISGSSPVHIALNTISGCFNDQNHYCVQYQDFSKIITPPAFPGDLICVYQRCCLETHIANISDAQSNGITLSCMMPGAAKRGLHQGNTSAVFKSMPSVRQCLNTAFQLDFGATDADGDSLSYHFAPIYRGGNDRDAKPTPSSIVFNDLYFSEGYSSTRPLGNNGDLAISSSTGIITGQGYKAGSYLVSVACDEWYQGVKISTVTRICTITISDCNKLVNAAIKKDSAAIGLPTTSITRCNSERTVHFNNVSTGAHAYYWDFGVTGTTSDTSTLQNPTFTYPVAGSYQLTMVAIGTNCNDTLHTTVVLSDDNVAVDFTVQGAHCFGDTLTLTDGSTTTGTVTQDLWTIGYSDYSGSPVNYLIPYEGLIPIRHTVITQGGCISSASSQFSVQHSEISASSDTTVVKNEALYIQAYGGSEYLWTAILPAYFLSSDLKSPIQQVSTWTTGANYVFVVVGKDAKGCGGADTVRVTVTDQGYAFVPSAFTPNNDGLNDILKLKLSGYNLLAFKIFNRRGNEVFSTTNAGSGWDGTYKGTEAAAEVYFWMAKAQSNGGAVTVFKGDVMLVR